MPPLSEPITAPVSSTITGTTEDVPPNEDGVYDPDVYDPDVYE